MNDQNETAQLRFLEETAIRLRQNGFTVKTMVDNRPPVCGGGGAPPPRRGGRAVGWGGGRGAPPAGQGPFAGGGARPRAGGGGGGRGGEPPPAPKAPGHTGDYRILADFGDAVLAGHPTERGVQFVTWEWDFDREGVHHGHYFQDDYDAAKRDFTVRSGLVQKTPFLSRSSLRRSTACWRSSVNRTKRYPSDGIRNWRSSWNRSADCCPRMCRGSGMRRNRAA